LYTVIVNGQAHEVEATPAMPLLWVLRDRLKLRGTKAGCGIGRCGACAVHLDGQAAFSCVMPISAATGKAITTIEGLAGDPHHPIFRAWLQEGVSQCGYCQPGQIMVATTLLAQNSEPADEDIDRVMSGVLCRCGTYQRIRRAIHRAADLLRDDRNADVQRG
jgi:aerobic-type carbon monoxide dehydrogenase small subunit (CoxS/CutS family)